MAPEGTTGADFAYVGTRRSTFNVYELVVPLVVASTTTTDGNVALL